MTELLGVLGELVIFILVAIIIFSISLIFFIYKYFHDQGKFIPPFDLIDAKKLDEVTTKQLEETLKRVLTSKGYAEEQINNILVRTSSQTRTFRR